MKNTVKTDDIIFNFFKQINLIKMEQNLNDQDKIKYKEDIQNNRNHLNSLKGKDSSEWREYATKCMIEIMENKV